MKAPSPSVTPVPSGILQRKCACEGSPNVNDECAECSKKRLQIFPSVYEVLRSSGRPLDEGARDFMETHLGHRFNQVQIQSPTHTSGLTIARPDEPSELEAERAEEVIGRGQAFGASTRRQGMGLDFRQVRVHTDREAAESAKAVNAHAYTVGRNIVFSQGSYSPDTTEGRKLLAHELTHVVQQGIGKSALPSMLYRKAQEESWIKDKDGKLYYRSREEAERRKITLENEGGWSEYRITDFKLGGKVYWRVEVRGRKKLEEAVAKSGVETPSPGTTVRGAGTEASVDSLSQSRTDSAPSASTRRVFALTFDDGPDARELGTGVNCTELVLDTLKNRGIKAAFFIQTGVSFHGASDIGKKLVERMYKEGHKIGIHTGGKVDHEDHTKTNTDKRLKSELTSASRYIKQRTGDTTNLVNLVRPPYGHYTAAEKPVYASLGLTNLLWDIDGDKGAKSEAVLKKRLESSNPKDPGIPAIGARSWKGTTPSNPKIVILYHDIRRNTATNIGAVIDHIKKVTSDVSAGKDTADFAAP
jgi:peptidoglycan/xylan/chitin deacetylase (PgdA/CDA1 family)